MLAVQNPPGDRGRDSCVYSSINEHILFLWEQVQPSEVTRFRVQLQ